VPGLVAKRLIELTEGEPTTVNDPALAEKARSSLPEAGFYLAAPMRSCGSDDFGFYGQIAPAIMMFVGLEGGPGTQNLPLHHPRYLPPSEAVGAAARAGCRLHSGDGNRVVL
jgi:metal-dependent amidase/aminoacylase/carboxypeptidase family protein